MTKTIEILLKKTNLFLIFLFLSSFGFSQGYNDATKAYIRKYKDIAIKEMKTYKIPASITLAQGILESGSGNSRLARIANNHFGIKCHKNWHGKKFYMDDDEKHECFRHYRKPEESYRDHSLFLSTKSRYAFLFDYKITDYKKWAYGLKRAGYATNPKYPKLLINLIEKYELYKYDKGYKGGGKSSKKHETGYANANTLPYNISYKEKGLSKTGRMVYSNNKVKFVFARKGDTYKKIAYEFNLYPYQIRNYNDVNRKHVLKAGEIVYIKHKRRKAAKKYKTHKVRKGESLWQISQIYGIKLKRLLKLNNLPKGTKWTNYGKVLKLR